MDSIVIPVVTGLAVGISLIVVMIFVGASFENSPTLFYGDPGTNVIFRDPGASEYYPYYLRHTMVLVETGEDIDGCCDNVAIIESTENTGVFIIDESGDDELDETI